MRLLDLVEQYHRVRAPPDRLRQLAAFLVAHVSGRRADHPGDGVLLHVLGHVEPHEGFLIVEQEFRECPGGLRLADARGAEEDERPGRPVGILQPGTRPAHGIGDGGEPLGLPDHPPLELRFEPREPLALRFEHFRDGDPGPLGDDLGDVFGVDFLFQVLALLLDLGEALLRLGDLPLERGDPAVADLGGLLQVAAARGLLRLGAKLLHLCFLRLEPRDRVLLRLPLGLHHLGALAQLGELLLDLGSPLLRGLVLLLGEGRQLDFVLHDLALDLVDLLGQRVDLDPQAARGLVHQVDRLVGEEAVADVAMRQRRRGDQRVIRYAYAVVHLIALLETAQNGDRVLDRRLAHVHGLETPLEGRVLLDMLAVLVERSGAHHVQLAARQRGLQHVGRIHRPFGRPGAHQRMQLVDEDDVLALRARDLLEHGLEPVLELAAIFGPGDQRAQIERHEMLVAQRLGDVPVHDALRQPFDDRRLTDPRLADQDGVVLGAPRQHLHHAADLLVPPDHRVDLALAGQFGEVAGVSLERLILLLGLLVGHAV